MTSPRLHDEPQDRARSERAWLVAMRAGDDRGFEAMYRAYVTGMCAFANSYVDSPDDAEEIVQDVFLAVWALRREIEMPHGVGPYLYAAARNRALNAVRGRQSVRALHERVARDRALDTASEHAPLQERIVAAKDLAEALERAVAGMPPRCREVFALLRYRHLSYADAATVLGISPKTVEIHMGRALALLRERLAPWR